MGFLRLWLSGYLRPTRVGERLKERPAPHWGLYAQLTRALLDSLLLYAPLALLGRVPSTPSWLSFLAAERYYAASVGFMPAFLLAQWLLAGAAMHVALRLAGWRSDLDQILNLTGMAALVVGAFLVVWDWAYILLGGRSPVLLGLSHLALDAWAALIVATGLRTLLGVPVRVGLWLFLLGLAVGLPPAIVFVRAPV